MEVMLTNLNQHLAGKTTISKNKSDSKLKPKTIFQDSPIFLKEISSNRGINFLTKILVKMMNDQCGQKITKGLDRLTIE